MPRNVSESLQWRQLTREMRLAIANFQRRAPVDLVGLAQHLGLTVRAATLPPGRSGEIRPAGTGGFIIKVNRHDPIGRQRFTVAHEIAHFLLHRNLIGAGIEDDALYRSNQTDQIEAEANRLAADIVMPTGLVLDAIRVAETLGVVDIQTELASQFQVSPAAMGIKLGG
jgi:hypothetical protein